KMALKLLFPASGSTWRVSPAARLGRTPMNRTAKLYAARRNMFHLNVLVTETARSGTAWAGAPFPVRAATALGSRDISDERVSICEIDLSIKRSKLQSSITRTLLLKPTSLARYSVLHTSQAKKPESRTPIR